MTKLFNPEVMGAGIKILNAPTDPTHAVRKIDLEGFVRAQRLEITSVTTLSLPKLADDFIIQCYDETKQLIIPDSITETDTTIEVVFLFAQTGIIRVLFIGGSSGN